ncbi:MAG: hypothetical protein QNK23_08055 [Crocinitomicaceae bacterium]|nr:hypothetical protein [Crocinitomicaceae bacterium]
MSEAFENLEKRIGGLEKDLIKNKPKKVRWYKTPSIILSVIALTTSVIFSVFSIKNAQKEKEASSFGTKISSIEENIEKLMEAQMHYQENLTQQDLGINGKNSFGMLWNAQSNLLLDKIMDLYDDSTSAHINPNQLLQLGQNLQMTSRMLQSREVFLKALERSTNHSTKSIALRALANLFSIPSTYQDKNTSREYRKEEINLVKEQFYGEYLNQTLSRSFELWAMDEYFNIGDTILANTLIDSAVYYGNKLKYQAQKDEITRRLQGIWDLFNKGIDMFDLKEDWKVKMVNQGIYGEARIVQSPAGIFLSMKFFREGSLVFYMFGNGYLGVNQEMVFDAQVTRFDNPYPVSAIIKIKLKDGETAWGSFSELSKPKEPLYFY